MDNTVTLCGHYNAANEFEQRLCQSRDAMVEKQMPAVGKSGVWQFVAPCEPTTTTADIFKKTVSLRSWQLGADAPYSANYVSAPAIWKGSVDDANS